MATHWQENQVALMIGMLMVGMCALGANGIDCRANISGPTIQGRPYTVRIMNASSADPAVLYCRVICLESGGYIPAVGIILTELGRHEQTRIENVTEEGLYTITYEPIQSCNLSNNIDLLEFRYSFHPLNASVDKTVLTCGVVHPLSQPPCWAQSYAIIHYIFDTEIPTTMMPTESCTTTILTMPTVAASGTYGGGGLTEPSIGNLVRIFSPLTAILALALVIAISIAVIEGVIIRHQLLSHKIKPQKDIHVNQM